MKILCDVHIAMKIAKFLSSKGVQTEHVNQILDKWNTKDYKIIQYADKNDFVILTKDKDFKNSHLITKTPKKLIKINLGNHSTNQSIKIFENILAQLNDLFDNNQFCFVEINSDDFVVIKGD